MTILFEGSIEELAYELDLNPSIFDGLRELESLGQREARSRGIGACVCAPGTWPRFPVDTRERRPHGRSQWTFGNSD